MVDFLGVSLSLFTVIMWAFTYVAFTTPPSSPVDGVILLVAALATAATATYYLY